MTTTLTKDGQFIDILKKTGITAKRWRNSGAFTPPADVNYRGELRVHTGGKPELIATDDKFRQAIVKPTLGRYEGESFLVGMDETANFVCRLPKPAESVAEAHEILRPTGVMPHTIRQGEWFFVPVEGELPEMGDVRHNQRLGGTTHSAAEYRQGYVGMKYMEVARGPITDGRTGRHKTVDLGDKWHQVYRNTEKQLDQEPEKVRRFD